MLFRIVTAVTLLKIIWTVTILKIICGTGWNKLWCWNHMSGIRMSLYMWCRRYNIAHCDDRSRTGIIHTWRKDVISWSVAYGLGYLTICHIRNWQPSNYLCDKSDTYTPTLPGDVISWSVPCWAGVPDQLSQTQIEIRNKENLKGVTQLGREIWFIGLLFVRLGHMNLL